MEGDLESQLAISCSQLRLLVVRLGCIQLIFRQVGFIAILEQRFFFFKKKNVALCKLTVGT